MVIFIDYQKLIVGTNDKYKNVASTINGFLIFDIQAERCKII